MMGMSDAALTALRSIPSRGSRRTRPKVTYTRRHGTLYRDRQKAPSKRARRRQRFMAARAERMDRNGRERGWRRILRALAGRRS